MTQKHTPGPWTFSTTGKIMQGYSQGLAIAQYGEANLIAGIFSDVRGGDETAKANAALIAAAPDLLEALKETKRFMDFMPKGIGRGAAAPLYQQVTAAIARATRTELTTPL